MVDVPVCAVHRRYGRRCDHAATSGLSLELPQTQFIATVGGHSSLLRDSGLRWRFGGGDVRLGIFRAPPGRPGVERQFSELSMTKSSSPSRAPHANYYSVCGHTHSTHFSPR